MSSRFLQGDGYPILYVYFGEQLLSSYKMPYVKDNGNSSYIRQYFEPYPEDSIRSHKLLSGNYVQDLPVGFNLGIKIKYSSILASHLKTIYEKITESQSVATKSLKLQPRHNLEAVYPVIYTGKFPIESENMWRHSILLEFQVTQIIESPSFVIPN